MTALLLLINALVAIAMIILILLQRTDPSGGGMFGGTASNAPVVRNPLAKPTAWLAAVFLLNSLTLAYLSHHQASHADTVMSAPVAATPGQAANQPQSIPAPGEIPVNNAGQPLLNNAGQPIIGPVDAVSPSPLISPSQPTSPTA